MLEDDFTYVLRKALLGNGLSPAAAATRAGLAEHEVQAMLDGRFSAAAARKLAPVLGLNAEALARHSVYQPRPLTLGGIIRLDLPFGDERVNAWLVTAGDCCLLFDAGYHGTGLLQAIANHGRAGGRLVPDYVFITHAHRDHVGGLDELRAHGLPVYADDLAGTSAIIPGGSVKCGSLTVRACDLSGHARPALGFHLSGLAQPVLVTGDAIFAGSIGGCSSPTVYQHALRRLHDVLDPLPQATVLLPGHGPATTLGEERAANPFL